MNVEPRSGEMIERVTIKLWSDVPNGAFGLDQNFDAGVSCFAKREPVHGLAIRAGAQTGEVPTDLFWVRGRDMTWPEQITAGHVVEWRARRYRVLDAISVGQMRRFTRITAMDLGVIV
jgi:hypothetical protein